MRYFHWLIIIVFFILAGCSVNSRNSASNINHAKSGKLNDKLVEAYLHTQPDADYQYSYNIITEGHAKDPEEKTQESKEPDVEQANALWKRMRKGFSIKTISHARIDAQLRWYSVHPQYLERIYDRASPVLYYVLQEIEKAGIPAEIALLPVVESAYQPFAYSHAAASGIWQFIPTTGRAYGLKQNWWYDGRRDLVESTRAGIAYLKKLHNQFGDWKLALAAYNTGENRVAREIRRNRRRGLPTTFWHLNLPNETRQYVPKLLAVKKIIENPQRYGLDLRYIADQRKIVAVNIGSQIDLAIAAELAGISLEDIYKLNPGFNRWATSPHGPHRLMLPIEVANDFKRKLRKLPKSKRIVWKQYKVSGRQSVSNIARAYNISPSMLKSVNSIRGRYVSAGTTIKIPVSYIAKSNYTLTLTQRINDKRSQVATRRLSRFGRRQQNSFSRKQGTRRYATTTSKTKKSRGYTSRHTDVYRSRRTYRVRRGDTLSKVARRYKVSRRTLARWNRISHRARLRRGQRLVIYSKRSRSIRERKSPIRIISQSTKGTRKKRITYIVRRGDTLYSIARRFRISVGSIKSWNRRLRKRSRIQPGQRLKLYVQRKSRRRG